MANIDTKPPPPTKKAQDVRYGKLYWHLFDKYAKKNRNKKMEKMKSSACSF